MAWSRKVQGIFIYYSIMLKDMPIEKANKQFAINRAYWIPPDPDTLNKKLAELALSDTILFFPFVAHNYYVLDKTRTGVVRIDPPMEKGHLLYSTCYRDMFIGPAVEWDGTKWVSTDDHTPDENELARRNMIDRIGKMVFVPAGRDPNSIIQKVIKKNPAELVVLHCTVNDQFVKDGGQELERREVLTVQS